MLRNYLLILLFLPAFLLAENDVKRKKTYRTQAGTIIRPPQPILEKNKSNSKQDHVVSKNRKKQNSLSKRMKDADDLKNLMTEIETLKSQLNTLSGMVQVPRVDTVLIFNTMYDTLTIMDTTLLYTNATTTIYDTTVIYDSLYIYRYDTTTISNTLFDTLVVLDTNYVYTSNTNYVKDTMWVFASDTLMVFDTAWVYAYDTTFIRDSLWIFAFDSTTIYDTLSIFNNDTVTIHTYSRNFTPVISDGVLSQFPKWQTLDDAIKARNAGDKNAQEWINQALFEANGDWTKAGDAYLKFQNLFSTSEMKGMFRNSNDPTLIGPEFKYRSVVFDTLQILTYDTTVIQDTIRDLVHQTLMEYDTLVIDDPKRVIEFATHPGHEMFIRYYGNGNIRERGMTKDDKRNGSWIFYDDVGNVVRKVKYDMGKIVFDNDFSKKKNRKSFAIKDISLNVDTKPIPKTKIVLDYNKILEYSKIKLKFIVDKEGKVHKISVMKSTRDDKLDLEIINTLKNTEYIPAMLNQKPITAWAEFESEFNKPKPTFKKISSIFGLKTFRKK